VRSHPRAKTHPEALVLRFDAPLYYANVPYLEEWLIKRVAERPRLRYIVIDCRGVNTVDATAVEGLEEIVSGYRERGIEVAFTHAKRPVRERFAKAGWKERFGERIVLSTTREALRAAGPFQARRASQAGGRRNGSRLTPEDS
jgi:SulP family sulfate permease